MNQEYVIINKTASQKRIEELNKAISLCQPEQQLVKDLLEQELFIKKEILSQSTPLVPEIEKAFDAAREFDSIDGVVDINIVLNMPSHDLSDLQEKTTKENYISNLKLDI